MKRFAGMRTAFGAFFLSVLVFLFALGMVGTMPDEAAAQIRAAYTKNVDEPGRVPYQYMREVNPSDVCTGNFCLIPFTAVPAGKRLVLQHVTALVAVADTGQPSFAALGDYAVTNQGNVAIISQPFTKTTVSILGTTFWALDAPVHAYYEPGATPKLKFFSSAASGFVMNFSLHGYLIDASN